MKIFLCHGYASHATATYFERALEKEHEVYYVGTPWRERAGRAPNEDLSVLIAEKILPNPDLVLYIESGLGFFPRGWEKMACPTAGYLIDVHTDFSVRQDYASFFDHLFVAHKDYVGRFEDLGFQNVHWLPVACDPQLHGRVATDLVYDIGFVGNLGQHPQRKALLQTLEARYKMNDFRRYYPKEDLTKVYSSSKIVFNYAINKDVNMRVFEALASGSLLMTNPTENGMNDLFRAGEHYVEYSDERSLIEKVDYYLTHDVERNRIAEAGRRLVVSQHTYDLRCRDLLDAIRTESSQRVAKVRAMSASDLRTAYGNVYSNLRLVDAAFDEFSTAWEAKDGRLAATKGLARTILRRLNATVGFTQLLKRTKNALVHRS